MSGGVMHLKDPRGDKHPCFYGTTDLDEGVEFRVVMPDVDFRCVGRAPDGIIARAAVSAILNMIVTYWEPQSSKERREEVGEIDF